MDPRIHWGDILMRVEVPNRTEETDRKLQNSTNNLINRHDHKRHSMLAWHITCASGARSNRVRNNVLRKVAAAHPPLPPNSTRGITPGLIDPLLGNVPGNSIAFPPLGKNQGRLRVGGRTRVAQAAAAYTANQALLNPVQGSSLQANPPQLNQIQATPAQTNQGYGNLAPSKRRANGEHKGRRTKRQTSNRHDSSDSSKMDTSSEGGSSSTV